MARTPRLVAADGGVYSKNEAAAKAKGVKRVSNRSTKSTARRFEQRTRWVGLGVIADNLISMGNALARQANRPGP
jgi:IS5 family transposase